MPNYHWNWLPCWAAIAYNKPVINLKGVIVAKS